MNALYRIDPKAHDAYDGSYTGGLPDPISFLVDDGVLVPVEPCEHGKYDRHWGGTTSTQINPLGFPFVGRGCEGAGLDDDDE